MATTFWTVQYGSAKHDVMLEHDYWSGTAMIMIDGETVCNLREKLFDWGLKHRVTVGDVECVVAVEATPWATYRYRLSINGETQPPIPPSNPSRWFIPWRWPPLAWVYVVLGLMILETIQSVITGHWTMDHILFQIDHWIAPG